MKQPHDSVAPGAAVRPILAAVDFSRPSNAAVRHAARLARQGNAPLILVHVIDRLPPDMLLDPTPAHQARRKAANRQLAALAAETARLWPHLHRELREGHPVQAIVALARRARAELVVVGTHGRTGLKRALIGSVAERVVRLAPCPVLVVR